MELPHSLDVERVLLSSLVRYPQEIPEYITHMSENMFHALVHKTIFAAIKKVFSDKKTVDAVLIADFLKNVGLANQDDIDIPNYVAINAARSAVEPDRIGVFFKDAYKYMVARDTISALKKAAVAVRKNINGSVSELMTQVETSLAVIKTTELQGEEKPIAFYETLAPYIEGIDKRENEHGIKTPFRQWNKWWGPLTPGDLYIIAAPPKTGKSTILSVISDAPFSPFNKGKKIKVLILDTELETELVQRRKTSALSQVRESYIRDGRWKQNAEMVGKIENAFAEVSSRSDDASPKIYHKYVANVPIDKICNIVRRWKATCVEPDEECLIIYDYLKITSEKIDDSNKEWQVLGQKCDTLKHLGSEVKAAVCCAVQTNSANDVAASQRLKWFASAIFMFRKKTPEELAEHGEEFGTHVLYPMVLRHEGDDWGEESWVKEQKAGGIVWTPNSLQLEVKNFDMREVGTYADVVEKMSKQIDITENKKDWKKPSKEESDDLF